MTFAGVSGASLQSFSCLPDHAGTGAGVNDPSGTGKAITKCTATLQKAATAFVKAKLGSLAKCVNTVLACRQLKPGVACLTKASDTCDKAFTKIASATTKLVSAVDKSCTESVIAYASLRTTNAANLAALATECAAHGVANLDTLAQYETCLFRQHECRVEDLLRFEAPRAAELLQAVGHELRSGFCPPRGACP